jgi:hypothetical protein
MVTMDADLMATASTLSKAIQAQGHRIDTLRNESGELLSSERLVNSLSTVSLKEEKKGMRAEILCLNAESKPQVVEVAGFEHRQPSKS